MDVWCLRQAISHANAIMQRIKWGKREQRSSWSPKKIHSKASRRWSQKEMRTKRGVVCLMSYILCLLNVKSDWQPLHISPGSRLAIRTVALMPRSNVWRRSVLRCHRIVSCLGGKYISSRSSWWIDVRWDLRRWRAWAGDWLQGGTMEGCWHLLPDLCRGLIGERRFVSMIVKHYCDFSVSPG